MFLKTTNPTFLNFGDIVSSDIDFSSSHKINLNSKYEELNKNMINNLYNNMINFNIDITGYNGFKEAQISLGGLPLNEVNINTLESLKQHNLFDYRKFTIIPIVWYNISIYLFEEIFVWSYIN